jgi:hypothetical protein
MSFVMGIVKRRPGARPKIGWFTDHHERPPRAQLQQIADGFVEAVPSHGLWDGTGSSRYKQSHPVLAFILCLAAWIACPTGPLLSAQKDKNAKPASTGPAAAPVFAPDKGKFRIMLDGNVIGNEEFEISSSGETWTARGSTTAHSPGGTDIKATGQLKLSADGTPIHYDWSAQIQKKATGAVDFATGTARCSIVLASASPLLKDFKFESPRVAVLDNNLYYQYAVLARMYDWKAGGKQTFPVLIPQDMVPGSISVESLGPQEVENVQYETLRINSTDLEILLYLDATHRMVRLDVPSSKVTIERE